MNFSPAFYHAIFDSMHTAVILLDDGLRILYLNLAAESLFKISSKRYQGISLHNVISEYGATPEGVDKAIRNSQRFTKRKTLLKLPMADEMLVDYTVTPLPEYEKCLLMEIEPLGRTIQIRQEEMLVSSQAVAQDMVRGLAHEIKNPLGGLRGAAQLLHRQLDEPELKEYTDIIINEADRLRDLVDQLLGPHKSTNLEQINIHEILEYIRKLIAVEAKDVLIKVDYDPSIPEITADRAQLLQVFLNLIKNAVQALVGVDHPVMLLKTRIQRKFTIGNDQHNIILRVDVIDNGSGIDEELSEKLFFPMVSGRAEGTGLGLSIAQTIVNRHNGLIKFEQQGGMTMFSVFLPFGDSDER